MEHSDQGRYEEAIQAYDEAIMLDNSSTTSWYGRGNDLALLERNNESLQAFERALMAQ